MAAAAGAAGCACRDGAAPTPPKAQLVAPEPVSKLPAGEGGASGREAAGGKLAALAAVGAAAVGAKDGKKGRRPLGQVTNSKGGATSRGAQRAAR